MDKVDTEELNTDRTIGNVAVSAEYKLKTVCKARVSSNVVVIGRVHLIVQSQNENSRIK